MQQMRNKVASYKDPLQAVRIKKSYLDNVRHIAKEQDRSIRSVLERAISVWMIARENYKEDENGRDKKS